ncbi:hypothetical protein TNCV_188471 [Trichonephila clavipes]|nr:hypothetical protein TNCV_188471 [Trichonephila clavipes]
MNQTCFQNVEEWSETNITGNNSFQWYFLTWSQVKWADIENNVEFLSKETPDIKIDDNCLFEVERRLNVHLNSNKLEQLENQHAEKLNSISFKHREGQQCLSVLWFRSILLPPMLLHFTDILELQVPFQNAFSLLESQAYLRYGLTFPTKTLAPSIAELLGSSESLQEFAARINKLGTQIFQSSNAAQNMQVRNANDQLLQSRFISGLRNDIRRFVLARDPNNLEESINAALIEEQNVKLNQIANDERTGLSPLQTETSVISALTNKLEEINLRVERLQEASSVTAHKTGGGLFRRRETVFKCYYCGLEGHKQAECRKRRAKERTLNYQPPCGNAAGEFSVFRQPNIHSFDRRRVQFQESAFRDNYAAPRHSANISQSTSRDRGDVTRFRRNTRNGNLNFRGESRF